MGDKKDIFSLKKKKAGIYINGMQLLETTSCDISIEILITLTVT